MPRDLDNNHPGYPTIIEGLMVSPFKREKETKKKKKKDGPKGGKDKAADSKKNQDVLKKNKKGEYKVFEFGNYPLTNESKPKNGIWRMMLPCDADWEIAKPDEEEKADTKIGGVGVKAGGKKKGKD